MLFVENGEIKNEVIEIEVKPKAKKLINKNKLIIVEDNETA